MSPGFSVSRTTNRAPFLLARTALPQAIRTRGPRYDALGRLRFRFRMVGKPGSNPVISCSTRRPSETSSLLGFPFRGRKMNAMMRRSAWLHWLLSAYLWLISWIPLGHWNRQREGTLLQALLSGRGIQAADLGMLAFVTLPAVLFWIAYKRNSFWFARRCVVGDANSILVASLHLRHGYDLATRLREGSHHEGSTPSRRS